MLDELGPEQFAQWKRHPVTAMVLERYLPDLRTAMERETLDAWLNGNLSLVQEQQVKGTLLGAYLLETLSLDKVRVFYGLEAKL